MVHYFTLLALVFFAHSNAHLPLLFPNFFRPAGLRLAGVAGGSEGDTGWLTRKAFRARMAPAPTKTKAQKAAAAASSSKGKKKKWSKGKVKDKAQNAVVLDKPTFDKIYKEVPTYKFISVSVLIDRMKIGGSLARKAINQLEKDGHIKKISRGRSQYIYTRATASD